MTKRPLSSAILLLAVTLGTAITALAFAYPLSSTAIRDAYFLGNRNDEQTADYLSKYAHHLPAPKTGPYVQEISLDTPFTQVVRHSQVAWNYHAPSAVEEFQGKPLPLRVHVDIVLTPSYSPIPETNGANLYQWVPDFWNDFKVKFIQDNKEIPARNTRGGPVFAYEDSGRPYYVTGARIELEYDPEKIESDPVDIDVLTPDGQKIETTFDLARLR
jgi:hypothetical protein